MENRTDLIGISNETEQSLTRSQQIDFHESRLIECSPVLNDAVAGLVIGRISSEYKWEEVPRMSGNTDFISYR